MEAQKGLDIRRLEDMYEEVRGQIRELKSRIDKQVERVEQVTRDRPRAALAVTFTTGAVLGGLIALILSRRD